MLPEVYLYIVRTVQNFRIVQVNLLLLEKKKMKIYMKKVKNGDHGGKAKAYNL